MTNYGIVLIDDLRSFIEPTEALVIRTEKDALFWAIGLSPADVISELWLDHDLGEDSNGNVTSIMSVVAKLEELAFFDKAPEIHVIRIHTSNPVGGKQIEQALGRFFRTQRVYAGDYFTGN